MTPAMLDLVREVRDAVRTMKQLPEWVNEASPSFASDLRAQASKLQAALAVLYEAEVPPSLADVPRWIVEAPDAPLRCGWARLEGRSAYACDGHALLVVDDVETAPDGSYFWADSAAAVRAVAMIEAPPPESARRSMTVETAALAHATTVDRSYKPALLLAGDIVLSAKILRRWVLATARVTGATELAIDLGGACDAVTFRGPGWRAVVMPIAASDEERAALRDVGAVVGAPAPPGVGDRVLDETDDHGRPA